MNDHKLIKWILFILMVIFLYVGYLGISIYKKAYIPNVRIRQKVYYLIIPTGSTYDDVLRIMKEDKILINPGAFDWAADQKNYPKHIYPGRYKIRNRMSNNRLINILRAGLQEPVKLTFNNIRTKDELAEKISDQIEASKSSILRLLSDENFLHTYGFTGQTVIGMFIPNTYEFWWTTDSLGFFNKMYKEYQKFWNAGRLKKAENAGLSVNEVITLASIVDEETRKESEKSRIAGVYMNRLKKKIPLQADPTIKFALGNFSIRRILKQHLAIESPYNTYKYYGLPPGPIRIPSVQTVEAVLNYEKNDYLYFCAKDDFSGYHVFAKTLEQHNRNARLYQRALSRRKIYR